MALARKTNKKTVIGIFLVAIFLCSLPFFLPAPNQTTQTPHLQPTDPFGDSQTPLGAGSLPQAFAGGSNPKIEPDLLNITFLLQEGYVQDGNVRVIVQTQETHKLESQASALRANLTAAFPEMSLAALSVPYAKLDSLAALSYVSQVYLDRKIHTCDSTSLQLIQPPDEWANVTATYGSLTGAGVKIAIIDTGIDDTHPDFFFPNGTSKIIASADFTSSNHTWDGYGHGTHCASIAAGTGAASNGSYIGVAPEALLINAKALYDNGTGYSSAAISAIQWAMGQGANVLSLSFGSSLSKTDGSDSVSQAVDWATSQGAVCCVAAGNYGYYHGTILSPACAKTAIAVGACERSRALASFSSSGPTSDYRIKPDLIAPGMDITAARADGTSMGTVVNQYYTNASGTSMAAPHVAGAVALIKQAHSTWTSQQIRSALVESANETGVNARGDLRRLDVTNVGGGLTDVANAITVTTFASNMSVSFYVNQTLAPAILTAPLTFSPSASSANFNLVKCLSDLPFPMSYANDTVTFSCPANTTAGWSGRLTVPGGSQFKTAISIPVLAVTEYLPPPSSSWTVVNAVQTPAKWPQVYTIAGDKLYLADAHLSGLILEYKLPEMTLLRNMSLPEKMINSIVVSDGYLYAGTTYNYVFKVSLSTFQIEVKTELPHKYNYNPVNQNFPGITKLLFCNSQLFVATYDGFIYKMDSLTLNLLNVTSINWTVMTGVVADSNLYYITTTGYLWKVNPSNFQAIRLDLGVEAFGLNSLVAANGNLYVIVNNDIWTPYITDYLQRIIKVSYDLDIVGYGDFVTPFTFHVDLAYDDNELYILAHTPNIEEETNQMDYILRVNSESLSLEASLNYSILIKTTSDYFGDQPLRYDCENIFAWNNYIICSFDSGILCVTKDLSSQSSLPTCISSSVNSTSAGQPCQVSTWWHSKMGLSGFIASTNNSGTWTNQTLQSLTGNLATANFSLTLNNNNGSSVAWKLYCRDVNNRWSDTGIQTFNVTPSQFFTLTILPYEITGVNYAPGQYSFPSQTAVNVSLNGAYSNVLTNAYKLQNWLVDGQPQTGNYTMVTMNQNHTVQAQCYLTSQIVEWERFDPVHYIFSNGAPLSNETLNACSPFYGQTFTVGAISHTVTSVKILVFDFKGNIKGPLTVSIKATLNGIPYGPDLANGTVDTSSVPTGNVWVAVPMTYPSLNAPLVLNSNTKYAIVASDQKDTYDSCLKWCFQDVVTDFSDPGFYRLDMNNYTWEPISNFDYRFKDVSTIFQVWGYTTQNCSTYTISASAGDNGAIFPSGEINVGYNSSQAFTITANPHYHIADVLVDGASLGSVTSFNFTNITGSHTIIANFAIDSYSIFATAIGNGTIYPSGNVTVNYGSTRSFSFSSEDHYRVLDVLVDNISVGAVSSYYFYNVTSDHTITAIFAIKTVAIYIASNPRGQIVPYGNGTVYVDYGGNQTFSIIPNPHYHIVNVYIGSTSVGAVTSYTLTNVTATVTILADYAGDTYYLTSSAGSHGTISPSGTVSVIYPANQSYTITPNSHYHVADVLVNDVSVGAVTSYFYVNPGVNSTITASFTIDTYTINASAGANGAISPNGEVSVNYSSSQRFNITANTNYHIADVQVDGASVGAVSTYTFSSVQAAHTITASFAAGPSSTPTPPPSSDGNSNGGGSTSSQTASPSPSEQPTATPSPTATSMQPTPTPHPTAQIDYTPVYVGVPVVLVIAVVLAVFWKKR